MFRFSKTSLIFTALAALCVAAIIVLNSYVLDMTHGCYNLIDIVLM